jgi:hypothetical protein
MLNGRLKTKSYAALSSRKENVSAMIKDARFITGSTLI